MPWHQGVNLFVDYVVNGQPSSSTPAPQLQRPLVSKPQDHQLDTLSANASPDLRRINVDSSVQISENKPSRPIPQEQANQVENVRVTNTLLRETIAVKDVSRLRFISLDS